MINRGGFSEHYPEQQEQGYLTWALAQTPLEHVRETAASIRRMEDHLETLGIYTNKVGRPPFADTVALDLLGVEATELEPRIKQGVNRRNIEDNVLMFTQLERGTPYIPLGDILGASGYPVTVTLPNRNQPAYRNPGINYESIGDLGEHGLEPRFKLAIIGKDNTHMTRGVVTRTRDGKGVDFSPQDRLRKILNVIQPAGHLLVSAAFSVQHIRQLFQQDRAFAEEVLSSHQVAYLRAYALNNGQTHTVPPLLVFERRT